MTKKLLRNVARCRNCKTKIESFHRHDFVTCKCFTNSVRNTGIFIDGGLEYRRSGGNFLNLEDLSQYEE